LVPVSPPVSFIWDPCSIAETQHTRKSSARHCLHGYIIIPIPPWLYYYTYTLMDTLLYPFGILLYLYPYEYITIFFRVYYYTYISRGILLCLYLNGYTTISIFQKIYHYLYTLLSIWLYLYTYGYSTRPIPLWVYYYTHTYTIIGILLHNQFSR